MWYSQIVYSAVIDMRPIEFVRARVSQVRRGFLVPFAPGNPMMMKEPYDFFRRNPANEGLVGPYPPGWSRQSNFGTVERQPPRTGPNYPQATQTPIMVAPPLLAPRPHVGDVPSERTISEHGEDYTMFYRGAIGKPRHIGMQGETYDFTY